jgi:hypothetical protein
VPVRLLEVAMRKEEVREGQRPSLEMTAAVV